MTGVREDLLAPVRDLTERDAIEFWRWLTGPDAQPTLVTALGDVFTELPTGEIGFLDTYEGTFRVVAPDRSRWATELSLESNLEAWFTPALVLALRRRGVTLGEGECYSPIVPLILSGKMEPDNFHTTSWRVHLAVMGQIYEQSKDLPPGTPVSGFRVE